MLVGYFEVDLLWGWFLTLCWFAAFVVFVRVVDFVV